jgi:hypothetical protein
VPSATWLLVFWTLTFAAWLLTHIVALVRVLRSTSLEQKWKWWSMFPLATPWASWKAGARVVAIIWVSLGVLYIVLRAMD